jgi:hypothetical protein
MTDDREDPSQVLKEIRAVVRTLVDIRHLHEFQARMARVSELAVREAERANKGRLNRLKAGLREVHEFQAQKLSLLEMSLRGAERDMNHCLMGLIGGDEEPSDYVREYVAQEGLHAHFEALTREALDGRL